MKRLSVRLSIVGAVLALGTATIAHSVLSEKGDEPGQNGDPKVAAATAPGSAPPSPIRVDSQTRGADLSELKPPPAEAFERSKSLSSVSHEASPATVVRHEGPEGSGEPVAVSDSTETASDADESFPIQEVSYPTATEMQRADVDSSAGSFSTSTAVAAPPPAPVYGASFAETVPQDTTSDMVTADSPLEKSAAPSPPPYTLPAEQTAVSDARRSEVGSPTSSLSTFPGYGAEAGVSAAQPVSARTTTSGGLGVPVSSDNPADGSGQITAVSGSSDDTNPMPESSGIPTDTSTFPSSSLTADTSPGRGTTPSSPSVYPSANERVFPAAPPDSTYVPSSGAISASGSSDATEGLGTRGLPAAQAPHTDAATFAAGSNGPAALLASNLPGPRQLEGQQAPAIMLEKTAPEEIQVERPATFQIRVRNTGNAPAHNVVVVDRVPLGTDFVDSVPPIAPTADGVLVWSLGTIQPGGEATVTLNVLPKVAGEIGSVAQASFQAQASVRVICTKPELELDVSVSQEILIGQPASLEITVTNTGNGAAEKVVLEEDVPEGFTHAAGRQLEHEIGTLRPQESRRLTLVLDSAKPGVFENRLTVRGEGHLFDEDVRQIAVISPQLQVGMQGPTLRYLDRQATYAVHLANPGTASARNVELVTYLPKGMKYVTSDNHGQYDSQSHAVYWSLEELPPDKQGDVHVTVLPIEPGNHKLKTDVRAELGLKEICEHEVAVEGLAEISFTVSDVADPIEVGSNTTYEIRVHNRGSKADTEIQLVADLPPGVTPTSGDGPTQGTVQGQRVVFPPLARLGPNEEAIFKIHAQGAVTGDHVIRAQIRSAELRVPVTKEEMTRVYSDG